MDDDQLNDLKRSWGDSLAKITTTFDRQLQEFKRYFEALNPGGRQWLKQWLIRAEELQGDMQSQSPVSIRIHVDHVEIDPEGDTRYEGHAHFGPAILLKAIDAWEKGEEFTPPPIATL